MGTGLRKAAIWPVENGFGRVASGGEAELVTQWRLRPGEVRGKVRGWCRELWMGVGMWGMGQTILNCRRYENRFRHKFRLIVDFTFFFPFFARCNTMAKF